MRTALHFGLLLSLLATGGAHCFSGREGTPAGGLFPSIEGWTLKPEQTDYTRSNLYELIDGAADLFLLYGFEHLAVAEYWQGDSMDVRVEIYDHETPLNAFGMYSQERKSDYAFIPIGIQGYVEEGVLNFLKGKYYVKCSSHAPGLTARKGLETVARAVESNLKGEASWPGGLGLLPATDRMPNSEVYVIQDYLGYSFFRPAFTARYGAAPSVELFVMICEDSADAARILERYAGVQRGNASSVDGGGLRAADPNNGSVALFAKGRFLAGAVGSASGEPERRSLGLLRESLSAAE